MAMEKRPNGPVTAVSMARKSASASSTRDETDNGATYIAQAWIGQIEHVRAAGDYPGVLYVSLGDWNRVAAVVGLEQLDGRRMPATAQFMDNPVMIVPDLSDGVAYLGRRVMP